MFYFQTLYQTALNGIDSAGVSAGMTQIAQYIIMLSLLWGAYRAWVAGGDVRMLGIAAIQYFAAGIVFLNYGSAFRGVNDGFNSLANFIQSTTAGGTDVFGRWLGDLQTYWQANGMASLWGLITGSLAALLEGLLLLISYVIFPLTYAAFSLFYALYGSILYVCGPLVLALFPAPGFGQLARTYLVNLLIFNAWGLLYSIFGALMVAINMNSVAGVLSNASFLGGFQGLSQSLLLGLASVLLSVCIALIPYLARRIVEGDLGTTMLSMVKTVFA
jgi:hypothetical protein